ncbi:cyclase family protein [Tepidibacter hydrothermalis]|uniref:Cyclase family protein n=1 Tax=Tepidibacter hydrothermalis TaxID=3036126 RepID=A0ABY8EEN7_9FIRM|nr:cyclase family protein [Tepidibacter hydrothermalis]WFD10244.1 cyclase family protein [Tepidibacter hydrothermalis]
MLDITLKLDKNNKVWKWLESQENKLINAGHVGTHVDVYKKSNIPLEYFKTKGVLIDCTNYSLDEEIGIEALKDIEIKESSFVMFKTNIQSNYPYGSDVYVKQHPELSWELIDYLLERKVYFIGIDCAGIRRGKEHVKADVKSEENNTYVIENLDLSKLNDTIEDEFDVYTMWIDNPFATGLSTRVLVDII